MTRDEVIKKWNESGSYHRNCWIAKSIFGWTEYKTKENNWFEPISALWKPMNGITKLPDWCGDDRVALSILSAKEFFFSISAGWKVDDDGVHHTDKYHCSIEKPLYDPDDPEIGGWCLCTIASAREDTIAKSICLAVLIALEVS